MPIITNHDKLLKNTPALLFTNYDSVSFFITNYDKVLTNCDRHYKLRQNYYKLRQPRTCTETSEEQVDVLNCRVDHV